MLESLIRWLHDTPLAPFGELLDMGGPVMLVLALMAVAVLSAALYALIISIMASPRHSQQLQSSIDEWRAGDTQGAMKPLGNSRNPLAGLLSFTFAQRSAGEDQQSLREEVSRRAQQLFRPFEPPLKLLEAVAALAPLLGLLGTVMGMMAAFSALASATGGADPSQLSAGIYEALITTAAGLIIAIPAAAIAAWLDYRMRRQQQLVNDLLTQALSVRGAVDPAPAVVGARAIKANPHGSPETRSETRETRGAREAYHAAG